MTAPLRVGIAGARGFGKHHAKWCRRAGCEVTALFGTTEESAAAAADTLRETLGFQGRAFHDWDRFVAEGGFDAAAVCSPPEQHARNACDLLEAGKHVLCEKPLVWNWSEAPMQLLEDATAIVEAAARHDRILAVNAQYPAALAGWEALHQEAIGRAPRYERLFFCMESKAPPRSEHGAAEAWVDLGPHPLALIDAIAPGSIDWETLRHQDGPREAVLDFDWVSEDRRISVHLEVRRKPGPELRRQLGNQDLVVDVGAKVVDGEFFTQLRAGEREWVGKDLMQESVERFLEAVRTGDESRVLVDGRAALRQLEALIGVWERCWLSP